MNPLTLQPISGSLHGLIKVPGDKSISHRSIIFGSIATGTTTVTNFLDGEDCMRTINAFKEMGVTIQKNGSNITIEGTGLSGLIEPKKKLDFGNSGTTTRLMLGLLAGLPFKTTIYGDASLSKRPMSRVVDPLRLMGARIDGVQQGNYLPLTIKGTTLKSIEYDLPVKSAQVKSALLLAGLHSENKTVVREKSPTRNHTETMLQAFGANIKTGGHTISISKTTDLQGCHVEVPGDISSAAFFIVAACMVPRSEIILKDVGLNETRTGIIDVVLQMGAKLTIQNERIVGGEKIGDILINGSQLSGVTIEGDTIPRLIDEIPILALLATQADGTTIIKDAQELKVKETDRLLAVSENLSKLGADVTPTEDGMIIKGNTKLKGGSFKSYDDHRIAMMGIIASLVTEETVVVDNIDCINISYPNFVNDLQSISK
ncbi:3-phosphoshikimate 1-carboxyvinyltransferase [Oceanobacillus kimchii]|uniref:3-phosphoshikimate 1-carboxyvinyltransferase n=1 Tax=Oceanobacillus kimchii TaxID=746691 RepID=UPI000346138B|nr:3-phosphoshikimate 1-carboxyvinyltransferase [Oceanobacillus kimchii]